MLKLKTSVNLPQLLCIVVSAAQNGEFERFGGFSFLLLLHVMKKQGWKAHFRLLQHQADFNPKIRITWLPNRTPDNLKGCFFFSRHSMEYPFKIQELTAK